MKKMTAVKKSILCAVCIALCYIIPLMFHGVQNAGAIFCPMHIPVFICGLVCGWQFGLLCGLSGPAISCVLTGMPPISSLPGMMIELAIYGVVSGLLMKAIHTKSTYADLYISLIIAIVVGRVLGGLTNAFLFASSQYSIATWVTAYVIQSWPGTLVQLIFIPTIVFALMKAQLIPERYPRGELTYETK